MRRVLQFAACLYASFSFGEGSNLRRETELVEKQLDTHLRIVLHCKPERDTQDCVDRIEAIESMEVIHKHQDIGAWAVAVDDSDQDTMQQLESGGFFDITSDPIRKPMYIQDSVRVEDGRKLQFWNRQDVPYGIDMVKAQDVWEKYGVRGAGVKVCVMDTGILGEHEDFIASKLSGYSGNEAVTPWDRDGNGHGTHVSGTIAAADNDEGVVGVAPDAEIYTVRVFDNQGFFFGSDVVAAAKACAASGAQIISMSLGGPSYDGDEKRIFELLYDQGIISIAAAGNDGNDDYSFPASYGRVMSVAAVNSNRNHASFSQFNDRVDIAAPGVNVRSTWNNGRYSSISGTSMATPHVSGVAALLLSYKSSATPAQLFDAMINTAQNPNTAGRDNKYGNGIVNAVAAMEALIRGNIEGPGDNSEVECESGIKFTFEFQTDDYGYETSWELFDMTNDVLVDFGSEGSYGNNVDVLTEKCLDGNSCYNLTIMDSYGDGFCCGQGSPGFQLSIDGQVLQANTDFTNAIVIPGIGSCPNNSAPTDPPVDSPTDSPVDSPTDSPVTNPTNPPVDPPTPAPIPSPTNPPSSEECCFLFWCWSC